MRILYVEPFETGSHASFTRALTEGIEAEWTTLTLPGRHWKWRMRGSAAYFALAHAEVLARDYDLVVASSYLPLAELVGLAPQLRETPTVLYFHENQLAFPTSGPPRERDHHFGFTQLISALAATRCVFNSAYNRDSFLDAATQLLRRLPDATPACWVPEIRARSEVLPVPVALPDAAPVEPAQTDPDPGGPLLLWNHRWEHDKNPETCFEGLMKLADEGVPFRVAVCGARFTRAPAVFERAREALGERVVHFGEASRAAYVEWLNRADIVLSTAHHEFFGISVVEAVHHGARPLVPDRLAYRELWPASFRYADDDAFVPALRSLLTSGGTHRADRRSLTKPFATSTVLPRYRALFEALVAEA